MKPVFALIPALFTFLHIFSQTAPPVNSGEVIAAGNQSIDSGYYKKALSFYEQVNRSDTNYVKSLYGRVLCYQADSQYSKAIPLCEEALKLKEQREFEPVIYSTYGNILNNDGKKEEAIRVFDEAIRKYPSYSLLYLNKGIALYEMARYSESENFFKQTLLINPYQYSANFWLGLCAINEGKILPSFLSFVGYLLVSPEGKYSKRCVSILASMANTKDEILEFKKKNSGEQDENFTTTEEILLSKIALEKEYKLKMSLDDPIFRQIQAVFEKLEYKQEDSDFWMQYYVPIYKKIFDEGQFENFIFWSFKNVQLKQIQDFNKKNKKDIEHFTAEAGTYFNQIRDTRLLQYTKRDTLRIKYLYSDDQLAGHGELTVDGKNYTGPWTFYYPAGNIKAIGQFDDKGREGAWTYYFFPGTLKARENYANGKLEGRQLTYSEFGILINDQNFSNDQKNGVQSYHYVNGRLFSTTSYKDGKRDGESREYYSDGQLSTVSQYENDWLSGPFTTYFNNGRLKKSGSYQKGNLDGPYQEYYDNGQLNSRGSFKDGKKDNEWKTFYDDGKIKSREFFADTKQEGDEEDFYEDSLLLTRYHYKKGLLNGEAISYDKDQKPYARFQFSNGKLESAAYFDKAGKMISTSETKNDRLELDICLPDGTRTTHRPLNNNGKIDGIETNYYHNGTVSEATEYRDGEKTGSNITYYMNGNKKYEATLNDGNITGAAINYYQNGKISSQGWYENGKAAGNWNYYNELGKLTRISYMSDDELSGFQTEYYYNGAKSVEKKFYKGCLMEMHQFDSSGNLLIYDSFPQFSGNFLLLYPGGKKLQEVKYERGEFEGMFVQYYFDGSVEFSEYFKGGLADSGYAGYYYHNIRQTEGQFKAGVKTGVWKYYNEEGKLEAIEKYANGETDGPVRYYDNLNNSISEVSYRHGEKNGMISDFDPDSSLINVLHFDDGDFIGYSYKDNAGKLLPEIKSENGKLVIKSFFQNGLPSNYCEYVNSKRNGGDTIYYTNNKFRSINNSIFGLYEGVSTEYFSNGTPAIIGNYMNDHLHGKRLEFNSKGVLIRETNYHLGDRHGESKYYSANGELLETQYFYDGTLLSVKK
jgi:uncharacterized protein